jgi:hypothetical protein
MDFLVYLLVAVFVYLPWLCVSYWLSRQIGTSRPGPSRVLALFVRLAIFVGLAMVLPTVAGLLLFFWAFVVADSPWFAVAYLLAVAPAWSLARRLDLQFDQRLRTAARALAFLGLVFWLPPVVVLVPAIIVVEA